MHSPEYAARIDEVKRRAHGRWTEILQKPGRRRAHPEASQPALPALRRHRSLPVHRQVRRRQLPLPALRSRWWFRLSKPVRHRSPIIPLS